MYIYIAYKYSKVSNKKTLITLLEDVAKELEAKGHTTFLLGRDIQLWGENNLHTIRKLGAIIKNLRKADRLLAMVTSEVASGGLLFELLLAKILRKPVYISLKNGVKNTCPNFLVKHVQSFGNLSEITKYL